VLTLFPIQQRTTVKLDDLVIRLHHTDPEPFQTVRIKLLNRYRDELVSDAAGRLAAQMTAAADTLVSLPGSDNETVQLRAATELL
jgi:hypothetical protein